MSKPQHKQITIKLDDREAEVDEKLADLILNLWKLNINTVMSCQNNEPKNYVWIMFASVIDAELFMNTVAEFAGGKTSVYQKMMLNWENVKNEWMYGASPIDLGVTYTEGKDFVDEEFSGMHNIVFSVSVKFPSKHLKFVENKIEKAVCDQLHSQVMKEVSGALMEYVKTGREPEISNEVI